MLGGSGRGAPFAAVLVAAACARSDDARGTHRTAAVEVRPDPVLSPQAMYERCFGDDPPPQGPLTASGHMEAGFHVFAHTCVTCHQPSGLGMPNAFPPLAGSDFLMADAGRAIDIVLRGLTGPISVAGKPYGATMPSHAFLSDDDVANVLTFVRNTWGNQGRPLTREEVRAHRAPDAGPLEVDSDRSAP